MMKMMVLMTICLKNKSNLILIDFDVAYLHEFLSVHAAYKYVKYSIEFIIFRLINLFIFKQIITIFIYATIT